MLKLIDKKIFTILCPILLPQCLNLIEFFKIKLENINLFPHSAALGFHKYEWIFHALLFLVQKCVNFPFKFLM